MTNMLKFTAAAIAVLMAMPIAAAMPYVRITGDDTTDQPCIVADSFAEVWVFIPAVILPDRPFVKTGAGVMCWSTVDGSGNTNTFTRPMGDLRTGRLPVLGTTYQEAGVTFQTFSGLSGFDVGCFFAYNSWGIPTSDVTLGICPAAPSVDPILELLP